MICAAVSIGRFSHMKPKTIPERPSSSRTTTKGLPKRVRFCSSMGTNSCSYSTSHLSGGDSIMEHPFCQMVWVNSCPTLTCSLVSTMLTRIYTRSGRCFFEAIMQQHQVVCSLCCRLPLTWTTFPAASHHLVPVLSVICLQKNLDICSFLFCPSPGYTLHAGQRPSRKQKEDRLHNTASPAHRR